MRKILWVLGIGVLCLPMLFVSWLVLASRWSKMDASTMRAPLFLRQTVAAVSYQKVGHGKAAMPGIDLRGLPENQLLASRGN